MKVPDNTKISQNRRGFLKYTSVAGAGALTALSGCVGGFSGDGTASSLTVSSFGGAFKEILEAELYEPFEEETGISIESQAQGGTAEIIPRIRSAVENGNAPVDVLTVPVPGVLRGLNSDLWMTHEESEFENLEFISDDLMKYDDDGNLVGIGSQAWLINLVHNTEETDNGPTSWTSLWDSTYEDQMAMMTPPVTGYMPDIAAAIHFDGADSLQSESDIRDVFEKLSEVTPQAQMWYTNEANFQSSLENGETPMGMLYNDITLVLQDQGAPVESTFVDEGSVLGSGRWVSPRTSENGTAITQFIDYASRPAVQDRVSRNLYTVPTIEEQHSELDAETYQRVAGPGLDSAIVPNFDMYVERQEFINQLWNELIIDS
ncbi:ABC transporter substrate-binding protein [Halobacteriales archaeon QS_6_64_34]|nr:MAG: ABC transporter substrate-binding protein [Halobacteriales archaeon QS_6_64_34]